MTKEAHSTPKLYSLQELSNMLQVTRRTLYSYVKTGKIKAVKIGGTWRVSEDNYLSFINGEHNNATSDNIE